MASADFVVLFDMGATHTRLAVTVDGKKFGTPHLFATDPSAKGVERLVAAIKELAGDTPIRHVVGGMPGHIDPHSGGLVHVPNLPHWLGRPVDRELAGALGVPVRLENDTALVGLGEAIYGAGRGYRIVMYETVSTGVNAVRLVDGEIDPAAVGFEVGAQLMTASDGRVTSLEAATGGAALERRTGRHAKELASTALWRDEARLLAHGLYNSVVHWSPDVVVFGGAMMRDISVEAIGRELDKLPPVFADWPKVVRAELGDVGGLYGALALAGR